MNDSKKRILDICNKEPETFDELANCVIAVINSQTDRYNNPTKVVGFSWRVEYQSEVSCSHNAPAGHKTNWGGRETDNNGKALPRSFPGYYGRVWIRYAGRNRNFGFDLFRQTLTYPGTGGGGTYDGPWTDLYSTWYQKFGRPGLRKNATYPEPECYSWDYRFFELDWPMIAEIAKEERVWALLNDQIYSHPTINFLWEDPEVKAADEAFMAVEKHVNSTK